MIKNLVDWYVNHSLPSSNMTVGEKDVAKTLKLRCKDGESAVGFIKPGDDIFISVCFFSLSLSSSAHALSCKIHLHTMMLVIFLLPNCWEFFPEIMRHPRNKL